ncbi:MAG: DUF1508 domain-containing protein [Candidatus Bathyarchaeota archaeon]|nr:DUF1508 domain-containing protein [Candidatus Bathyarchaeota archaeon]
MAGKILIVYSTKTGINAAAAYTIAEALKTVYALDVTIVDLKNGSPDITPFRNIIVGGGVDRANVYNEAVDFLEEDFWGKNVAVYFSCEDDENPRAKSTEDNTKKVLTKNTALKPIDVAAFGGCRLSQGRPVMDELNMNKVRDWAIELGKKFTALEPEPVVEVAPVVMKTPAPTPVVEMHTATEENEGVFEIICDAADRFRFHLKAGNGEIIAVSQSYGAKESAIVGIDSIKKNAPIAKIADLSTTEGVKTKQAKRPAGIVQDPVFEIQFNAPERYRFHLKAGNGEIIAVSQSYLSKQAAKGGIASVKKNAPAAPIVDQTIAAT